MKGIVIASHGDMAKGILESSKLFFGEQEQLKACCIYGSDSPDDFRETLKTAINEVDTGDGVIVFCDILSGTPSNSAAILMGEGMDNFEVVDGVNMPMVLQALAVREFGELDLNDLAEQGRQGIVILKEMLEKAETGDDED